MPLFPKKTKTIKALICLVAIGCLMPTGCVRRRLMVRSNPPGAMVYVDNQPIGTTPCATEFIYYGTREIRLVKAGYETLTVNQPLPAPWYQIPPFDFVSENIVPSKIQDYRTASYNLTPQVIVPTEQLIARGEQLRQTTLQGAVVPAATTAPLPVIPSGSTQGQPVFVPPAMGQPVAAQPNPGQPAFGQPSVGQPTFGQPTFGQPSVGQPAFGQPAQGQPTLAPTNPNVVPPSTVVPPANLLPPGSILTPPVTPPVTPLGTPGTTAIPIGGQSTEALPPPR